MCHFGLFALEDKGTLNHKTSTVFGPELAHKQLASHEKRLCTSVYKLFSALWGWPRFNLK